MPSPRINLPPSVIPEEKDALRLLLHSYPHPDHINAMGDEIDGVHPPPVDASAIATCFSYIENCNGVVAAGFSLR